MESNIRTAQKKRYNKGAYTSYLFRVRTDSELADRLGEHIAEGDCSVNLLITKALCEYMGVELPHKRYCTWERIRLFP